MNFFRLREYWQYRRIAKGRHGIHSPFIYRLIEEVLWNKAHRSSGKPFYVSEKGETWSSDPLIMALVAYFRFYEIHVMAAGKTEIVFHLKEKATGPYSLQPFYRLFEFGAEADQWMDSFSTISSDLHENDMILVRKIYDSAGQKATWEELCKQPQVRLSVDLFDAGLLLFSEDFKERQHFVLRHPY